MDVNLPDLAHRVTVFGSTRNIEATSAGVSSGSASGVRDCMAVPFSMDRPRWPIAVTGCLRPAFTLIARGGHCRDETDIVGVCAENGGLGQAHTSPVSRRSATGHHRRGHRGSARHTRPGPKTKESGVGVFASTTGHEQVSFVQDLASGLRAIFAIYSTALGPALGGTRFYPYATESDALADVLNLSRAMAYKAAVAGLDLGGGKAVIIGDPATDKTEPLLRAYGRFVQALGGRYYTACDVGTYVEDMDVVARECRYVTGRSPAQGGAGDSSVLTAYGVFQGMRAAAERVWGAPSLAGRRVGVNGVGKVGRHLVEHLVADGATVTVADVN